jgi:hypothetical protein
MKLPLLYTDMDRDNLGALSSAHVCHRNHKTLEVVEDLKAMLCIIEFHLI